MTLDDLERPIRTLAEKIVLRSQLEKNKDRPMLSAANCDSTAFLFQNAKANIAVGFGNRVRRTRGLSCHDNVMMHNALSRITAEEVNGK